MGVEIIKVNGRRMVQLPEKEYRELARRAGGDLESTGLPPLPQPGPDGNYPALEYARISLARKIISGRKRLGLSQTELARRAGIPAESLNRLEHGKTNATIKTIEKIDRALKAAERLSNKAEVAPAARLRA